MKQTTNWVEDKKRIVFEMFQVKKDEKEDFYEREWFELKTIKKGKIQSFDRIKWLKFVKFRKASTRKRKFCEKKMSHWKMCWWNKKENIFLAGQEWKEKK